MKESDITEPLAAEQERISQNNFSRGWLTSALRGAETGTERRPPPRHVSVASKVPTALEIGVPVQREEALRFWRKLLPVTRWENGQFNPPVRSRRIESSAMPRLLFQTLLSEAHGSEREPGFGRSISSLDRIRRSRAGVRFHTTMKIPADIW